MGHGGNVIDELMTDHREVEELFTDLWQLPHFMSHPAGWRPPVDCYRSAKRSQLVVVVELAGVDPAGLRVVVERGQLVVSGERRRQREEGSVYQLMEIEYGAFERRISPRSLGYPLKAFITAQVTQRRLDDVATAMAAIPEILEVDGVSGSTDLLIQVVAAHADDLYRIAGQILAIPGVERTSTALVMRQLVGYRITPLLQRLTG